MYIALTSTNELRADYVPQPPRGKWWRTPGRAKHVLIHSLANNQLKSSQPRLWHACSCSYHHFSSVNSTLSPSITPHSFTPSSKPTYSTNLSPPNTFFLAPGLTPQTLWLDRFFSAFWFSVFSFSSLLFLFVGSVRQTKLAVHQLLGVHNRSLSYHIIL